jgi:hypothetical protein
MSNELTLVVQSGDRVWIDLDSLVVYLRFVVDEGQKRAAEAYADGDPYIYAASMASQDIIRQIADHLVVTGMEAQEEMRSRSGFGRRS